jgi:hypothetical protein
MSKCIALSLILLFACTAPRCCEATIILQSPSPAKHDRFANDPSFIGNPYNWSGVGRGAWWATLITPTHFVSATHAHPADNSTIRFYESNDPNGTFIDRTVTGGQAIGSSDLWLGTLGTAVSSNITPYAIMSVNDNAAFLNREIYTYGNSDTSPPATNMRLGRNIIDVVIEDFVGPDPPASQGDIFPYDYDNLGGVGDDESYLQGGDSGGPSFTIIHGQPVLLGVHWFIFTDNETGQVGSADTLVSSYIDELNTAVAGISGESVSVVFVPEPSMITLIFLSFIFLSGRVPHLLPKTPRIEA